MKYISEIRAFVGTKRLYYNLQNSCSLESRIRTLSKSHDTQRDQEIKLSRVVLRSLSTVNVARLD